MGAGLNFGRLLADPQLPEAAALDVLSLARFQPGWIHGRKVGCADGEK